MVCSNIWSFSVEKHECLERLVSASDILFQKNQGRC